MTLTPIHDPKGLIKDAFAIEGIAAPECRSIFLDWALGLPAAVDVKGQVQALIDLYTPDHPHDHPMFATLQAALKDAGPARRRGGRANRLAALDGNG